MVKEIEVKWLKEKSGHKPGDLVKVDEKLVEQLIRKGDVELLVPVEMEVSKSGPEKLVEQILYGWFKQSDKVEGIYFNRKNELNCPTFKTKPKKNGIPDMVLCINLFGRKQYIAIEVKDGSKSRNIMDAQKIFNKYFKNFEEKKTEYFIDDKKININLFCVATQFSPLGRLFHKERIVSNYAGVKGDGWSDITCPRLEGERSKTFTRSIISLFREYRIKNECSSGIGVFYSDVLKKFDLNELTIQDGNLGNPILFCVKKGGDDKWKKRMIEL